MSRKLHPDFYTLDDQMTQEAILERSSLNNEAYKVLKHPFTRMKYILEEKGVMDSEGQQSLPQEFLMEMMEVNESLMELSMEPDSEKIHQLKEEVLRYETQLRSEIQPELETFDEKGEGDLEAVKDFYFKSRYLLRIKENLDKFASPD